MVRYTFATWAAPFYNAVFTLLLVVLANTAIARLCGRPVFNRLELLCVYSIVSVASALLSTDLLGILITLMGYPTRFATPTNGWDRLFEGALPRWLVVTDRSALKGFYEGNSTLYRWDHITAWLLPSLCWMLFAAALFIGFLSLAVLLRKQWVDSERLTFPIVQLPMAVAGSPRAFFGDRLVWAGLVIAGGITLLNGIHYLVPSVPNIPIKRRDFDLFTTPPWSAANPIRVSFYFFAITLGFLMPLDLSVSCWLFYLLYLGERAFVASLGLEPGSSAPYTSDQAFGAYMVIGLLAIWSARSHLVRTLGFALRTAATAQDDAEPTSYRSAYLGLMLGLGTAAIFARLAGMTPLVAIASITILVALAIVISRIRCELGFPVHDMHDMGPHAVLTRLVGSGSLSKSTLGAFSIFYWSDRVFRSHPMPHQLEGLRLAAGSRAGSDMLRAILAAGLFTLPVCFWIYLDGFYRLGAGTARVGPWGLDYGREIFPQLETWLRSPERPEPGPWIGMLAGATLAGVLAFARARFVGFPLHPLGYAVANSWGMFNLWVPVVIGSLCKAVVLRSGGLRAYRRATMLFYGLMLGEFAVGCSWTIIGMLVGTRTYDFWP